MQEIRNFTVYEHQRHAKLKKKICCFFVNAKNEGLSK